MLTDLHCHMLPAIDDGSRNVAQSIEMARIAVADGIATTILPPHHLNGLYVNRGEHLGCARFRNFRKSSGTVAYLYQLTPRGVVSKKRITRRFLDRKIEQVECLQEELPRSCAGLEHLIR